MLAMICLSNRNCRLSRNISKCNMREFSELPDRQISRRYLAISIHGHCSIPDSLVRPLEFTEGQSHWPTIHEKTAVEQFTAQQKCCINGPAHWMWEPIIRLLLLLAEWCYSKREKKKKKKVWGEGRCLSVLKASIINLLLHMQSYLHDGGFQILLQDYLFI